MINGGEIKVKINGEYKIVLGATIDDLEKNVNELMAEGYLPCGNLIINKDYFIQPMIKTNIEEVRE